MESFANLYSDAADLIIGSGDGHLLPGIDAAIDGMWFIAACQASSGNDSSWVRK